MLHIQSTSSSSTSETAHASRRNLRRTVWQPDCCLQSSSSTMLPDAAYCQITLNTCLMKSWSDQLMPTVFPSLNRYKLSGNCTSRRLDRVGTSDDRRRRRRRRWMCCCAHRHPYARAQSAILAWRWVVNDPSYRHSYVLRFAAFVCVCSSGYTTCRTTRTELILWTANLRLRLTHPALDSHGLLWGAVCPPHCPQCVCSSGYTTCRTTRTELILRTAVRDRRVPAATSDLDGRSAAGRPRRGKVVRRRCWNDTSRTAATVTTTYRPVAASVRWVQPRSRHTNRTEPAELYWTFVFIWEIGVVYELLFVNCSSCTARPSSLCRQLIGTK